jgi:hypothetical protein
MIQKAPSDGVKCINGKTMYDDGCYDCLYWVDEMECPPEKKKEK